MALLTFDPGQNTDIKKIFGYFVGGGLLAGLGVLLYKALPYINQLLEMTADTIWNTLVLGVLIILGIFFGFIVFNPKFWRALKYMGEGISQFFLGWAIEMNPFNILQYRIEKTEKDTQELLKYNEKLKGKAAEIKDKIEENDIDLKNAIESQQICSNALKANSRDISASENLELAVANIRTSKEYIDGIKPVYNDLLKLVDFTDRAYRSSNLGLRIAKNDLKKKRDLFETVTTASNAIAKAWKALLGDSNTNNDAEKAIEALKKDVGAKIGQIQSGIKITSSFMDNRDLENASKLQSTLKQLQGVDLDKLNYSETLDSAQTKLEMNNLTGGANRYTQFLNK